MPRDTMIGTDTAGAVVAFIVALIDSAIGSVMLAAAGPTLLNIFLTDVAALLATFFIAFTGAVTKEPIFSGGAVLLGAFIFAFILFRSTDCYNDFIRCNNQLKLKGRCFRHHPLPYDYLREY